MLTSRIKKSQTIYYQLFRMRTGEHPETSIPRLRDELPTYD